MPADHHENPNGVDHTKVLSDERCLLPLSRSKLYSRIDDAHVNHEKGKEGDELGHGRRVDEAVDGFPADVAPSATHRSAFLRLRWKPEWDLTRRTLAFHSFHHGSLGGYTESRQFPKACRIQELSHLAPQDTSPRGHCERPKG